MDRIKRILPLYLGPIVFIILEVIGKPESMNVQAFHVLATTIWIAIWWVTEAVPIAVTALLPIILFPLTGAVPLADTTVAYGHRYIFLYLGGFMIAIAIERWNLHRRIALNIINIIGSDISKIILGFMVATAFLSMWISNTATSVMMLPIGIAVVKQFKDASKDEAMSSNLGKGLMLAIAYSASIGGLATLIGTPPNLVLAGILEEIYGYELMFVDWIKFGLPISIVLLFICWKYLTKVAFKFKNTSLPGGKAEIAKMLKSLGKISFEEKRVLAVFIFTAIAWMSRSLIEKVLPAIDDTIIAMVSAIILFVIPSKDKKRKLITWEEATDLPWGIILLFGGGMALAKGFTSTGLAEWIAQQMSQLNNLHIILLILVLVALVNFLTEITSNLATTAMILPILAPMALSFNVNPLVIMVSVTVAASCAFMLPVATPPNAVVFGSGYLRIPDMVKSGVVLNFISIFLITIATYLLLPILWDIDMTGFPEAFKSTNILTD
ncbi:SLC13 family permease [Marivirga atlantica]|jgi:sodium-dependent dicarboxylate transporter 2/3/5|uniref:SLC13/DASS family transporter n=1 Tax=Marivirga atlantica TaxID=1548457 RepID=A0A937A7M5_9BACT|nr:SLC13 family permease [Marivirga atlantica]MBL0765100.1 SLC13/DASS family transporter [Marivirga atlantica]